MSHCVNEKKTPFHSYFHTENNHFILSEVDTNCHIRTNPSQYHPIHNPSSWRTDFRRNKSSAILTHNRNQLCAFWGDNNIWKNLIIIFTFYQTRNHSSLVEALLGCPKTGLSTGFFHFLTSRLGSDGEGQTKVTWTGHFRCTSLFSRSVSCIVLVVLTFSCLFVYIVYIFIYL